MKAIEFILTKYKRSEFDQAAWEAEWEAALPEYQEQFPKIKTLADLFKQFEHTDLMHPEDQLGRDSELFFLFRPKIYDE